MGQAKNRGTREQRIAQSKERQEQESLARLERIKKARELRIEAGEAIQRATPQQKKLMTALLLGLAVAGLPK